MAFDDKSKRKLLDLTYQYTVLLKMIMYMTLGFKFLLFLNGKYFD